MLISLWQQPYKTASALRADALINSCEPGLYLYTKHTLTLKLDNNKAEIYNV